MSDIINLMTHCLSDPSGQHMDTLLASYGLTATACCVYMTLSFSSVNSDRHAMAKGVQQSKMLLAQNDSPPPCRRSLVLIYLKQLRLALRLFPSVNAFCIAYT